MTNEQLVLLIKDGINEEENMLQLWKQNKGFIYKTAMKYHGYAEIDDLTQEGYIGLCNAVEHYDTGKGALFLSYAWFWIELAMRRHIGNCTGAMRIPVNARNEMQKYKQFINKYRKIHGREPSEDEICDFLDIDKKNYETIKRNVFISNYRSLDEVVGGENEDILLADIIASAQDVEEDVIKKFDTAIMQENLWKAVEELPEKRSYILCKRYQDNMTLQQIADTLGVTRGAVHLQEKKGISELRINNELRKHYKQYIGKGPLRHVGYREFNRTWTSATELAVLGYDY